MEWLVGLAYGLGAFFMITGVIILVLGKFSLQAYDVNTTTGLQDIPTNASNAMQYGITQMGSSGLLGWSGAIIAIVVGVFFLSYFMGGKKQRKY